MVDQKKDINEEEMQDMEDSSTEDAPKTEETSNENEENTDSEDSEENEDNEEETKSEEKESKSSKKSQKKSNSNSKKVAKRLEKKAKKAAARHAAVHSTEEKHTATAGANPWLLAILAVVVIANIIVAYMIVSNLGANNAVPGKEETKKAEISMKLLVNSKCTDCADIIAVTDEVKNADVNIIEEKTVEFDSAEGKSLIQKFEVTKLPAVVLTGEISDLKFQNFEEKSGALVFNQASAPYADAKTGQTKGLISITYLKSDACLQCQDLSRIITQFETAGMVFSEKKTVEASSDEGKALIAKYSLTKLPTLIFSSDLKEYEPVAQAWSVIGTIETDGSYVMRTPQAVGVPYLDLETNKVTGLVDVTYLSDDSCKTCYNVSVHKLILERFGMKFSSETMLDVASTNGKSFVHKYNITKVPTIVLSSDADTYPGLKEVWTSVGTIETDGTYIFRNPQLMTGSVYKDLSTGEVIGTPAPAQGTVDVEQ